MGSDTLLGPEETDQVAAAAVGWWLRCLLRGIDRGVGAGCPRLRDHSPVTSAHASLA
jgi:hypothetical protein